MPYAAIEGLRAEGFSAEDIPDARAQHVLNEASALIDAVTGQFFEPRPLTLVLEGRGAASLWLPFPIIRVDRVVVDGEIWHTGQSDLVVVGAPVVPGSDGPRITRVLGAWRHRAAIVVEGLWGYTEHDATPLGRTPLAIRRACLLLAARLAPPLANDAAGEARSTWRIIEERTRDQSVKLADPSSRVPHLSGDAEVDALLWPYVRRPGMGAA
jgi:hypothetical protein